MNRRSKQWFAKRCVIVAHTPAVVAAAELRHEANRLLDRAFSARAVNILALPPAEYQPYAERFIAQARKCWRLALVAEGITQ